MRIRSIIFTTIFAALAVSVACSRSASEKLTKYDKICSEENKGKKISATGFLMAADRVPCLKGVNLLRDCTFKFSNKSKPDAEGILLNIPEGKEKSQVETPETFNPNGKPSSIFARDDVSINFEDGTVIHPQGGTAIPVVVTGRVFLTNDKESPICTIYAEKVDKAEVAE